MPPPATPRITVEPSQLASSTPRGMVRRRFGHNNDTDLVPGGTQRCLEIGPAHTETSVDNLDPRVAALRAELGEIPGVGRVNILMRYLTIEASSHTVSWPEISARVAGVIKRYFDWDVDPVVKTRKVVNSN